MLGTLYSNLDLIAMLRVDKLQLNTKIHHTIVNLFYLYIRAVIIE